MSKEASAKSLSSGLDRATAAPIAKIFVVCDQKDTAPVWRNTISQKGLSMILKLSL